MIIKIILTTISIISLLIAFYEIKHRSNVRNLFIFSIGFIIYLVWNPGFANSLAFKVGVGRGVDLFIYLALSIMMLVIMILYILIARVNRNLSEIIRKLAVNEFVNSKK